MRILWLDNDRAYLKPYVDSLLDAGFAVDVVETASDAEARVRRETYDALIVDVMIPSRSSDDEINYSPTDTAAGYRTGLVFWQRNRDILGARRTPVLVLTVRLDESIRAAFAAEGLPAGRFATKYELSDPDLLVAKLASLTSALEEERRD